MGSISPPEEDFSFPNLPPFPSDVPTVPLLRISLARLLAGDTTEEDKLWQACCELGFFYFDLRGAHGRAENGQDIDGDGLLDSADEMFALANEVFDLPVEEKLKYDMSAKKSYFGYKGLGANVTDKKGTRDRNEFWNVSKDDIFGITDALPNPDAINRQESRDKFKRYMLASYSLVTLILGKLNTRLGLPKGTLQNLHKQTAVSGDQVRWVRSPPQPIDDRQVALGAHTDYGSVTILFNRLGGLQVLPPGDDADWAYVKPLRGHCIVNLGDALVKFTAGILRSNIHRIASPPGEQADQVRYSLVYFNRPEDDVILKVLDGSEMIKAKKREQGIGKEDEITAKQWILNRALGSRVGGDIKKVYGTDQERLDRLEKRDSGVAAA